MMDTKINSLVVLSFYLLRIAHTRTTLFDEYFDHEQTRDFLQHIAEKYPSITNLYSIGKSVRGKDLFVLEISATSGIRLGVANVKIIGNIHGNEPVGKEIILRLAEFLVEEYTNGTASIRKLLNTTRIHLLASANPDGFQQSKTARNDLECSENLSAGRKNAKGVDLDRNFPMNHEHVTLQPESESIKRWMNEIPFVASLSLHSGNVVAVYPFDYLFQSVDDVTPTSVTPDDDVFRYLSITYANNHPYMHEGKPCTDHEQSFQNGIVNGGTWYPIKDGMQDYNYLRKGCLEISIEMSCCKYPLANKLESIWTENQRPLISWLHEIHRGVKGIVAAAETGEGIPAILEIEQRPITFRTSSTGEYWRILLPGTYSMKVKSIVPGYNESIVVFTVADDKFEALWLNVTLTSIYAADKNENNSNSQPVTNNSTDIPRGTSTDRYEQVTDLLTERYEYVKSSSNSANNSRRPYHCDKNLFILLLLLFKQMVDIRYYL